MLGLLAAIPILFADNAPAAAAAEPARSEYSIFFWFLLPLAAFYFLILRPQHQQEKSRRQLLDALKKNDKVLTSAGIYGTVVSVDSEHDKVVLRVDDEKNVRFTFSKASIVRVVDAAQEKEKEKASETA
jgi:preprotein translocase subunit YajC